MLAEAWRVSEKQPPNAGHVSFRGTVPDVLGQPTAVSRGQAQAAMAGGRQGCLPRPSPLPRKLFHAAGDGDGSGSPLAMLLLNAMFFTRICSPNGRTRSVRDALSFHRRMEDTQLVQGMQLQMAELGLSRRSSP